MERTFEVEVTIVGTANVTVKAGSEDEAQAIAEQQVTVLHGENWCYDATGVREQWAEAENEELAVAT